MSCMDEISITDVDHEDDQDWEIALFTSSKQPLNLHFSDGGQDVDEDEDDDDDDDDDDEYEDYDDEEIDGNNYDGKVELGCPYCVENFDILGLCCHIDDQHFKEAKSGICPICVKRLDTNMTVHIIAQHENLLPSVLCILVNLCENVDIKVRSGGNQTTLSRLKEEDHSCSHPKVSSHVGSSSDLSHDPLFLSFVQTPRPAYRKESLQSKPPSEAASSRKTSNCDTAESMGFVAL
ncbi:hypothetical protein LIER_41152 [Lithospermum erythrorhizon]|uniref:Di19 zinc-binding domain-containing protein n=1 Tax=Lithospermum erythrorhizon TaxID=34254 RepID=A0AAV3R848_LITER